MMVVTYVPLAAASGLFFCLSFCRCVCICFMRATVAWLYTYLLAAFFMAVFLMLYWCPYLVSIAAADLAGTAAAMPQLTGNTAAA